MINTEAETQASAARATALRQYVERLEERLNALEQENQRLKSDLWTEGSRVAGLVLIAGAGWLLAALAIASLVWGI